MIMQPVPVPKYDFGETIVFDRSDSDYGKDNEGVLFGTVSGIEIYAQNYLVTCGSVKRPAYEWEVRYFLKEHDDLVPERCVLGPATVGEKR